MYLVLHLLALIPSTVSNYIFSESNNKCKEKLQESYTECSSSSSVPEAPSPVNSFDLSGENLNGLSWYLKAMKLKKKGRGEVPLEATATFREKALLFFIYLCT